MSLTPRENVLSLYRRQGYEHAPASLYLCDSQYKRFCKETGEKDYHALYQFPIHGTSGPSWKTHQPEAFLKYYNKLKEGYFIDGFGIAFEPGSEAAYHMTYMRHPMQNLKSMDELISYEFPDVFTDSNYDYKAEVAKIHEKGFAAGGSYECTVWERAWYMRSMEELMMDMLDEDEKAVYILDKVTDLACKIVKHYAEAGVDIINLGDDVGMQHSTMMSRELYTVWIKPRLKKVIDIAKEINPDILIQYHSCGYVEPFIGDLIDAGIDILNPVQPECMDFSEIHSKYGDRLSFNGTLGTQSTMPFGTPDDVRNIVNKNLDIAGKKGGLFVCPTHIIEPEVPWENIIAYIEAVKNYKL